MFEWLWNLVSADNDAFDAQQEKERLNRIFVNSGLEPPFREESDAIFVPSETGWRGVLHRHALGRANRNSRVRQDREGRAAAENRSAERIFDIAGRTS